MEFHIHLFIHLWAKREGSSWRTVPCSTNLQHNQHQHLDREKSPKHSHLSPVPALCLHPYTQNAAQISWYYLQGKCGGRTPGKPGAGRKDAPSQGSQQLGTYNQCCIISLNCTVWHKASICGCPTGVPMATAATAVLGPTATSEWWNCGNPLLYFTTAGQLWEAALKLEQGRKISDLPKAPTGKNLQFMPLNEGPTNAVQWHLLSPDS